MAIEKLTDIQKQRVKRLDNSLKECCYQGDLEGAKRVVMDLQSIYTQTGNTAKLMQAKNALFEVALEVGNLTFAEQGFIGVRAKTNSRTRVYLEATALLAICYLRQSEFLKAEPLVREVLTNDHVIKSEKRREEFRKLIIERFDEEGILYALKGEKTESLNFEDIHDAAIPLLKNKSEEELLTSIGKSLPISAKNALFQIDSISKKNLPSAERLKLPSPTQMIEDEKAGKTLFSSVKRVLYKSLCDKKSEIYKTYIKGGMDVIFDKKSIAFAVGQAMTGIGIGIKALAIPIVALILKFGIEVYCDRFTPVGVMGIR